MAIIRDPAVQQRMRILADLYQAAENMQRMKLWREHPGATDEEIYGRLVAWRQKRSYIPPKEMTNASDGQS